MHEEQKITELWPFPYPMRENQRIALEWLAEQEADHLILEAPVGAGKSNIGIAFSTWINRHYVPDPTDPKQRAGAFILTPQRILQDQYEKSFNDIKKIQLASLYGKSNYDCRAVNASCDIGSMVKKNKSTCEYCPYKIARTKAVMSLHPVLNYKLALTAWAFTGLFSKRPLMILDECHTLENHLIDFDALAITEWRCVKYNIKWKGQHKLEGAVKWIREYYLPEMATVVENMEPEIEVIQDKSGNEITRADTKKLKEYEKLVEHLEELQMMAARTIEHLNDNFVLVFDPKMFQFKRITGAYSFNKIVRPKAEKFLYMSSTVLNKDGFCDDLGINKDEAAFLSLDSEFPVENRPVYYMPRMKMNARWKEDDNTKKRVEMLDAVQKLCEMHKDDSGIIHTANFAIAQWLVEKLDIPQRIYHHNPDSGDDRNSIINAFTASPNPGVLISPSSTEGLDLKEDLARFAIFVKVPFGYLGDQWIKRRMEMSIEWYQRRALIDMIQGGGRIVRSVDDTGSVYILDGSFGFLYKQTLSMVPRWWKDSFQRV